MYALIDIVRFHDMTCFLYCITSVGSNQKLTISLKALTEDVDCGPRMSLDVASPMMMPVEREVILVVTLARSNVHHNTVP